MKELFEKIPTSWDELTLAQFQKLQSVNITETGDFDGLTVGVDNTLGVLSALTDVSVEELEVLPMKVVAEMGQRLAFMSKPPKIGKKNPIEWKKFDEVTYDNYITFSNQDWFHNLSNLHTVIKAFAKNKLTDEEVLSMPMSKVMTGFFFAQKHTKKSLHSMIQHLRRQVVLNKVKNMVKLPAYKLRWKSKEGKSTSHLDGTS